MKNWYHKQLSNQLPFFDGNVVVVSGSTVVAVVDVFVGFVVGGDVVGGSGVVDVVVGGGCGGVCRCC